MHCFVILEYPSIAEVDPPVPYRPGSLHLNAALKRERQREEEGGGGEILTLGEQHAGSSISAASLSCPLRHSWRLNFL